MRSRGIAEAPPTVLSEPAMMHAAYLEQTGEPEVIQDGQLPRPEPGSKKVLVRVAAAALNPIDAYLRSGKIVVEPER